MAARDYQKNRQLERERRQQRDAALRAAAEEEKNLATRLAQEEEYKREQFREVVEALEQCDEEAFQKKLGRMKAPGSLLHAAVAPGGLTMLHLAVSRGLLDAMEALLKLDSRSLATSDDEGQTSLHRAAAVDSSGELVDLLAEYAEAEDLERLDKRRRTPLDVAQEWALPEALAALRVARGRLAESRTGDENEEESDALEGGRVGSAAGRGRAASPTQGHVKAKFPNFGNMAAITAIQEGRFEAALGLIQEFTWVFVNNKDKAKRTLLHHACLKGRGEICEAVLARSDFSVADDVDNDMATALHLAALGEKVECCRAICESEAFTAHNAPDLRRRTALHLAAMRSNEEIYNIIAAHPLCNAALPDFQGRMAAQIAQDRGLDVEIPGLADRDIHL